MVMPVIPSQPNAELALNSEGVFTTTRFNPVPFFKVTLTEPGYLNVNTYQSGSLFDTRLSIYDSTERFNLINTDDDTLGSYSALIQYLPAGDYYISASYYENTTSMFGSFGLQLSFVPDSNPIQPNITDVGRISFLEAVTYTKEQFDFAVANARVGLFTQSELDSAVSNSKVGLFTQSELDSAISNSKTGLFTQAQLDTAVSNAKVGLFTQAQIDAVKSGSSVDNSSVLSNLMDVDISSGSHSVTFSKIKVDYAAFDFEKKIVGNALSNKITLSSSSANVSSGDGNDTVIGNIGNDTVDGGKGDDVIDGGTGNNFLTGGDGSDRINVGIGNNKIFGGLGNDSINSSAGNDFVNAGDGDDTVSVMDGNNTVVGGSGNDVISAGNGSDSIDGGAGNDLINAGSGDNKIVLGVGDDSVNSGVGNDSVNSGDGNDLVKSGDGNDSVTAGAGSDSIDAGAGDDKVDGGAGNDYLVSALGNDTLTGGADSDMFVLGLDLTHLKNITDFKSAADKLVFSDSSTPIPLDSSAFHAGKGLIAPISDTEHFIYNTTNGALFYDADGSGVGSQTVQIALIANKSALVASDILI